VPFALESEMTKPVRRWLLRQGLLIKAEFGLPWGICDLVGLSFDISRMAKRMAFRQHRPIGSMQRVELLRLIPDQETGRAITFNQLRTITEETIFVPDLDHELQTLIADRFVIPGKNGSLQKRNGWAPMHDRIVAVELKLSRVSEALSQAFSNRAFATESYIALPMKAAKRFTDGARYSQFRTAGIGVLGVTPTSCRVVSQPLETIEPDVTLQMHCVERFWRTRGSSTSTAARCVRAF
jgi:hypothetical protein